MNGVVTCKHLHTRHEIECLDCGYVWEEGHDHGPDGLMDTVGWAKPPHPPSSERGVGVKHVIGTDGLQAFLVEAAYRWKRFLAFSFVPVGAQPRPGMVAGADGKAKGDLIYAVAFVGEGPIQQAAIATQVSPEAPNIETVTPAQEKPA